MKRQGGVATTPTSDTDRIRAFTELACNRFAASAWPEVERLLALNWEDSREPGTAAWSAVACQVQRSRDYPTG